MIRFPTIICCLICIFHKTALAENKSVSFEEVREYALENSPAFSQLAAEAKKLKLDAQALGILENPELEGETRPFVSGHDGRHVEYEVGIRQPLRLSSFGMRTSVSQLMAQVASREEQVKLLEFGQKLALQFGAAWSLQERERNLNAAQSTARALQKLLDNSALNGVYPLSTSKTINAEVSALRADLVGLESDNARALAELTRSSGMRLAKTTLQRREFAALPHVEELKPDPELSFAQLAQAKIRLAEAQQRLARLDSFPRFAPSFGYERTTDGDDRVNIGFQIELPVFDRGQAARGIAQANVSAAQALARYANSDEFKQELELRYDAARAAQKQEQLYHTETIPALEQALTALRAEFAAGQGNPFEILQALTKLSAARERYLELYLRVITYRMEISLLVGKEV